MGQYQKWSLVAGMVGALLGVTRSPAAAQARQAVAVSTAPALTLAPAPTPGERDDGDAKRDPDPMGSASIGVKLGVAGTGAGKLTLNANGQSYTGRVDSRHGLQVALPIQFGGSGFGFTLEPYLSKSSMEHPVKNPAGVVTGTDQADLTAYGMYFGPVVNIQVARPVYLGVGLGLKAAYIMSDEFDLALDAYGRMPVSATYYVANQLGLVAEVGVGYGLSLFVDKPQPVLDAANRTVRNAEQDPRFGRAVTWDCSFGVRLP